jgi:FAD/FMN-containing dehydrogenase
VHLLHSPPYRSLLVLGYEDAPTAGDAVPSILEHEPLGLEGIDEQLLDDMTQLGLHRHDLSRLPDGHGYLLIEFGGESKEEADEKARKLMGELKVGKQGLRGMKLYDSREQEEHVWKVREAGLGATAFLPGKEDTYEGWEDSAVPPASRSTARSSRRRPTWSSRTGARSQASTATASRAGSCCRRCSARS